MSAIEKLKTVLLDPEGNVSIIGSNEDCRIIQESLAEIEKQFDLFVYATVKNKTKSIDDIIEEFLDALDFDEILCWARILGVEVNYPPIDDMWPDWQNELTVEVGNAMRKVGKK